MYDAFIYVNGWKIYVQQESRLAYGKADSKVLHNLINYRDLHLRLSGRIKLPQFVQCGFSYYVT